MGSLCVGCHLSPLLPLPSSQTPEHPSIDTFSSLWSETGHIPYRSGSSVPCFEPLATNSRLDNSKTRLGGGCFPHRISKSWGDTPYNLGFFEGLLLSLTLLQFCSVTMLGLDIRKTPCGVRYGDGLGRVWCPEARNLAGRVEL